MSNRIQRPNERQMMPAASGETMVRATRPSVQGNIDRMFQDFRNSFDDMMTPFFAPGSLLALPTAPLALIEGALPIRFPVIDVIDDGDNYKVRAELPGFSKENVEVNVGEDALELRAEVGADNQQKTRGNSRYLSRESAYSAFQRNIQFPEHVAPSKVEGTMRDGVLQLTIPKKEPTSAKMTRVSLK